MGIFMCVLFKLELYVKIRDPEVVEDKVVLFLKIISSQTEISFEMLSINRYHPTSTKPMLRC